MFTLVALPLAGLVSTTSVVAGQLLIVVGVCLDYTVYSFRR